MVAPVLADHMRAVCGALSTATAAPAGAAPGPVAVLRRRGSNLADAGDEASPAEGKHAAAIARRVGIKTEDGLLLIRDFLRASFGDVEARRVLTSTEASLIGAAPLEALEDFHADERRFAYACTGKLFFYGTGIGVTGTDCQRYSDAFGPILTEFAPEISRVVTGQVESVVGAHAASSGEEFAHLRDSKRFGCVLELFFAVVHCKGLAMADIQTLVKNVRDAAKRAAVDRYLPRRYVSGNDHRALLDGSRYSLLLCAIFGSAVSSIRWSDGDGGSIGRGAVEEKTLQARRGSLLSFDLDAIRGIDKLLLDSPGEIMYAELAIFRVIWGSYVAAFSDELSPAAPEISGVAHAEYAFGFGTHIALRAMLDAAKHCAAPDVVLEDAMRIVFWNAFHVQLIAFDPSTFARTPDEAVSDIELAVAILSGCGAKGARVASNALWNGERSAEKKWLGTNSLLRMASVLFPRQFFPLVSLLTELCASPDSSLDTFLALSERLCTQTENLDDGVISCTVRLSQEHLGNMYRFAESEDGQDVCSFLRHINIVAFGEGDGKSCLVAIDRDRRSQYGTALTANDSVGLVVESSSLVTWSCRWNGWDSVILVLRSLLVYLTDPGGDSNYEESNIEDLAQSSLKSLRLIENVCLSGASERRLELCEKFYELKLLELVCDIFVAAADPSRTNVWVTSSAQATIMSAAGTCLHALTPGSTKFPQYVVDHIVLSSTRSNALQACVTSLGYSSLPALSSVAKIATTILLKSEPLSSSNPAVNSSGNGRSGAVGVANFIQTIGLPLWLSLFHNQSGSAKPGAFADAWLLPAVSFELFSCVPESVLNGPVVASAVSTALVSVISSGHRAGSKDGDPFHYAAFSNALSLCIAVLNFRNVCLDELAANCLRADFDGADGLPLLAFEKMLLRPEVVHALAIVASGAPGTLTILEHAAVCSVDDRRCVGYASLCKGSDFLPNDVAGLQDKAARCLSLFVTCLYKMASVKGGPIIQVPWPAMGHSSLGCWFGGGAEIRRGFSGRVILSSNSNVADFVAAVVSCGQRAVARSILGPISGRPKVESSSVQSEEDARRDNEMLAAVVDKLSACYKSWLAGETDGGISDDQCRGETASSIAACVRILRSSWEVHGSVWLKEAWKVLKVWTLLSSLLASSPQRTKSGASCSAHNDSQNGLSACEPVNCKALEWTTSKVAGAVDSFDTHATWCVIITDILGVFASEIVFRSNDIAKVPAGRQNSGADAAESTEQRVRSEVFDDPAFAALRDSFSEHWMHRFLDVSQLGTLQSNSIPFPSVDCRLETVESITADINLDLGKQLNCAGSDVLFFYRRRGERSQQYGGNYAYDARTVARDLRMARVQEKDVVSLTGLIIVLNVLWSRVDAQLKLCKSFSALTTMMVMADSVAPTPSKMLTYASPQYCGKLCRVISYSMAVATPTAMLSPSVAFIHLELAMLLGFVSARLSPEELDQAALSTVRLDSVLSPPGTTDVSSMSPISRIAELIRRTCKLVRPNDHGTQARPVRIAVIRWLLLGGARLAVGSAFCSERDVSAFGEASMVALRILSSEPEICSAASIALSSIVLSSDVLLRSSFGRQGAAAGVLSAIGSLALLDRSHPDRSHVAAAADLVLFMTKMASSHAGAGANALLEISALQHLSSGSTAAMLPLGSEPVDTYSPTTFERDPVHRLWCASLSLASSLISCVEPRVDLSLPHTSYLNGILEFAGSNVSRITTVNLDRAGDWPPITPAMTEEGGARLHSSRHLTMARVEEAEVAMQTVFALANHAVDLRDAFRHVTSDLTSTSQRIVYQIYRLIRAEPIARWVRPVSEGERERCDLFLVGTEGSGLFSQGGSNSGWPMSPVLSPGGGASDNNGGVGNAGTPGGNGSGRSTGALTSPRRTPQQAVRAALGRLGNRGGSSSQVPPSPGMPLTPQMHSPMSLGTAVFSTGPTNKYQSPLSPWGTSAAGLITGSGVLFAEEVGQSLLRSMASALGALRRFSSLLDRPLFSPTMSITEGEHSVGLLVGIQFHVCTELQGSCEGDRRDALMLILEIALVLTLTHAVHFSKHGELTPGVRDELHRRLETVVSRMRRLVPPCPSHSIVHSDLEPFLKHLKHA